MGFDLVFQSLNPFGGFYECWRLGVQRVIGAGHSPIMKGDPILLGNGSRLTSSGNTQLSSLLYISVNAKCGNLVFLSHTAVTYLAAAAWAAFILFSMIGWGGLLQRILRLNGLGHWAVLASTGFAFSTVVGGVFNMAGIISRATLTIFLAAGFIWSIFLLARGLVGMGDMNMGLPSERSVRFLTIFGLVIAGILLAIRLVGSLVVLDTAAHPVTFNRYDDFQAYLVYPEKMIQTGRMGPDQFSLRRTPTHSLGGAAFLKALVLTALSEENLHLMDAGLGNILVVGLLLACLGQVRATIAASGFAILVFLAIPPPIFNTTSQLIAMAFFLSLFYVLLRIGEQSIRPSYAVLVGLLMAGICSLRTNLIPASIVFVGVSGLFAAFRSRKKAMAVWAMTLALSCGSLFVLPWLIDAYQWTGTLVPFSLRYYFASADFIAAYQKTTGWHSVAANIADLPGVPYVVLTVLASLLLFWLPRRSVERHLFLSLLATVGIGSLAVLVGQGGFNTLIKYVFPFLTGTLLITVILCLSVLQSGRRSSVKSEIGLLIAGIAIGSWVLSSAHGAASMYRAMVGTPTHALRSEHLIPQDIRSRYRSLQEAALPGTAILANLDYPFVLEFRRNRILIIDFAGGASAAPGMPFFKGGDALAGYLVAHGIRYVAYDYASECGAPKKGIWLSLATNDKYPFTQSIVRHTFDLHDNFLELAKTRKRVFDDGSTFLVDLTG